jgi:acetamidase/formamidase
MNGHRLDPTPETTRDVFSRDHAPVLTVDPGDTVTVGSLDASGYLARQTYPGQAQPTMFAQARGHCLTGPIEVRGARPGDMLYLGDGHAAQGDGEVGGTAIECPMTTEAVVSLAPGRPLGTIHAEAPAGRITFGFDADLNVAMGDALDAMVSWMQVLSGVGKAAALALASTCVDLRITQVVNQTWGVHAVLPAGAMRGVG